MTSDRQHTHIIHHSYMTLKKTIKRQINKQGFLFKPALMKGGVFVQNSHPPDPDQDKQMKTTKNENLFLLFTQPSREGG